MSGAIWYYPTIRNAILEVLPPSPDASGTGASLASVGLHARCTESSTQASSETTRRDAYTSLACTSLAGYMERVSICVPDLQV